MRNENRSGHAFWEAHRVAKSSKTSPAALMVMVPAGGEPSQKNAQYGSSITFMKEPGGSRQGLS